MAILLTVNNKVINDPSKKLICGDKVNFENIIKDTKEEFKPDGLDDKEPPTIKIAKKFTFESSSYSIKGEVKDNKSDIIYIEVDGIISDYPDRVLKIRN